MKWTSERKNPMDFHRKFIWWPTKITGVDGRTHHFWLETLLATSIVSYQEGVIRYFKNLDGSDI